MTRDGQLVAQAPNVPGEAQRAAQRVTLAPQETWSGVFADREVVRKYRVRATEDLRGTVRWSLSVDQRTIARGEAAIQASPNRPGKVELRMKTPELKPGLIVEAKLSVRLLGSDGRTELARDERRMYIFSDDPFAQRSPWLEGLKITLFDPVGKTADVFEQAKIPFRRTYNAAALAGLKEGILVIGEGTSLAQQRGLAEKMVELAARGVPVVCLAPASGTLSVPGIGESELPRPKRLVLAGPEAITELDKRLDAAAWPPEGKAVATSLVIAAERGRIVGRVIEDRSGWPWLVVQYDRGGGKLVICGFGIVGAWDAGPTPRYLLMRILESVTRERRV